MNPAKKPKKNKKVITRELEIIGKSRNQNQIISNLIEKVNLNHDYHKTNYVHLRLKVDRKSLKCQDNSDDKPTFYNTFTASDYPSNGRTGGLYFFLPVH